MEKCNCKCEKWRSISLEDNSIAPGMVIRKRVSDGEGNRISPCLMILVIEPNFIQLEEMGDNCLRLKNSKIRTERRNDFNADYEVCEEPELIYQKRMKELVDRD